MMITFQIATKNVLWMPRRQKHACMAAVLLKITQIRMVLLIAMTDARRTQSRWNQASAVAAVWKIDMDQNGIPDCIEGCKDNKVMLLPAHISNAGDQGSDYDSISCLQSAIGIVMGIVVMMVFRKILIL